MSEATQCWSCGKNIEKDLSKCPHCGISLENDNSVDDLDFLDDLLETTSSDETNTFDQELANNEALSSESDESEMELDFIIPDMDYVSGAKEETSSPKGEFDEGYGQDDTSDDELDFIIPDMDYVSGAKEETSSPKGEFDEGYGQEDTSDDELDFIIPDMDYVSGAKEETSSPKGEFDENYNPDASEETTAKLSTENDKISQKDKVSMLADMDSLFDEPEISETTNIVQPETMVETEATLAEKEKDSDVESEPIVLPDSISITSVGFKKLTWLFGSQSFYWSIIYVIIVFGSFEVVNPNLDPLNIQPDDFDITPFGFLISWSAFFAMGWFYSYKLRSYRVSPNVLHGLLFIVTITASIYITSILLVGIYNPGLQNPINYLLGTYFMIIPMHYLITFLTAGWFFFALGFKYLWRPIYEISPMSELNPTLSEL